MKRTVLNYLVIAAFAVAAVLTSCGGGGGIGGSSGKIKMTTEQGGNFSFYLAGSGTATVDWGDGSEKVTLTLNENGVGFDHDYPNATIRTITINGDNITGLQCISITNLDVSRCAELTQLNSHGTFKSLDISKNTALTSLVCIGQFTSLDVSMNTALTELNCSNNQLTSLDVSKNTALTRLDCSNNQLTSLDVSKNIALTYLNCSSNQLTSLDVSKNMAIKELQRGDNQFTAAALNALFRVQYKELVDKYSVTNEEIAILAESSLGSLSLESLLESCDEFNCSAAIRQDHLREGSKMIETEISITRGVTQSDVKALLRDAHNYRNRK